jgi:hypothetical protein
MSDTLTLPEADTSPRTRRSAGGREAKRAARSARSAQSAPYITRKIPYFEVLDEEGLATIERNANTILEEVGIELCNLKLGIRPRTPYVFYNSAYWTDLRRQLNEMVKSKRTPAWMLDYMLFTDDPDEVVAFYRKTLQVL